MKNWDVLVRRESLIVVNSVILVPHHFCEDCIVLKTFISLTASIALYAERQKLTLAKPSAIIYSRGECKSQSLSARIEKHSHTSRTPLPGFIHN